MLCFRKDYILVNASANELAALPTFRRRILVGLVDVLHGCMAKRRLFRTSSMNVLSKTRYCLHSAFQNSLYPSTSKCTTGKFRRSFIAIRRSNQHARQRDYAVVAVH